MSAELVLVVPTADVVAVLGGGVAWHGIRRGDGALVADLIARHGRFLPRSVVEVDPAWKQVIPYAVLRDGDAWFLMKRTRAGADARLHDRCSIGVGGHVNPADGGLDGDLSRALAREWHEELRVTFVPDFRFVGLLNDDSTPVGAVHLGLVHVGDAAGRPVEIRETEKLTGRFASAGEVGAVADRLETWSRIAFEYLTTEAEHADRAMASMSGQSR
ncbi:MAG TPA: phosphoesterase [Patescibacteria group bacterium]|nr:phosphoesterase [Patescibacteria group bacterium]